MQETFESGSQNFRDNLIDDITKADRAKMMHRRSP
jgi:hypothetical protein